MVRPSRQQDVASCHLGYQSFYWNSTEQLAHAAATDQRVRCVRQRFEWHYTFGAVPLCQLDLVGLVHQSARRSIQHPNAATTSISVAIVQPAARFHSDGIMDLVEFDLARLVSKSLYWDVAIQHWSVDAADQHGRFQ